MRRFIQSEASSCNRTTTVAFPWHRQMGLGMSPLITCIINSFTLSFEKPQEKLTVSIEHWMETQNYVFCSNFRGLKMPLMIKVCYLSVQLHVHVYF